MRYALWGGYMAAGQQRRERLWLRLPDGSPAATGSARSGMTCGFTEGSVRRWRRAWRDGGAEALRSRGPVSQERLSPQQGARLELELGKGRSRRSRTAAPLARRQRPGLCLARDARRAAVPETR